MWLYSYVIWEQLDASLVFVETYSLPNTRFDPRLYDIVFEVILVPQNNVKYYV